MSYEEVGIRLRTDGQVETTRGIDATATALDRMGRSAGAAVPQLDRVGKTAGQTSQAMQQLPMQITDVVTSLASGMPVWMVAIQQGGQIRDSFGGITPAAKALTSTLTPLRLAIGGTAATAAVLTAAFLAGRGESDAYTRAILLTGNAAGTTMGQLGAMAQTVEASIGTQRQAAAVLAELVSTGQVSRAQLLVGAEAALAMERSLGVEVTNTVRAFAELGKDPVAAAAKLNQQTNFLTLSVWEQIRSLTEQGRVAEAAAVAQEAYATKGIERAKEMETNLGLLERSWRGLGETAAWAWDQMLNIGRKDTTETDLGGVRRQIAELEVWQGSPTTSDSERASIEASLQQLRQQEAELQELLRLQARQASSQAAAAAAVRAQVSADTAGPPRTRASPSGPSNDEILRSRAINSVAAFRAFEAQGYAATDRYLFEQDEAERQAARRRQQQAEDYLQQLLDANTRNSAELIGDARERGEALIAIERDLALRRLEQLQVSGEDEVKLRAQIDQRSLLARQKLEQGLRQDDERRTEALAQSIETGLMNGFRNGNSIADIFLNELKAQFARTVLRVPIQATAQGMNSGIQALLGFVTGLGGSTGGFGSYGNTGGGVFNGGNVVPGFTMPGEGYHSGGIVGAGATFTRMLPAGAWKGAPRLHSGGMAGDEVPAILRRKEGVFTEEQMKALAPVDASRGGRPTLVFSPQISIDSRTDRAEVYALVMRAMDSTKSSMMEETERRMR